MKTLFSNDDLPVYFQEFLIYSLTLTIHKAQEKDLALQKMHAFSIYQLIFYLLTHDEVSGTWERLASDIIQLMNAMLNVSFIIKNILYSIYIYSIQMAIVMMTFSSYLLKGWKPVKYFLQYIYARFSVIINY